MTNETPTERQVDQVTALIGMLERTLEQLFEKDAENTALKIQVSILEESLRDWDEAANAAMDERNDHTERHCTCVKILRGKVRELEKRLTNLINAPDNAEILAETV